MDMTPGRRRLAIGAGIIATALVIAWAISTGLGGLFASDRLSREDLRAVWDYDHNAFLAQHRGEFGTTEKDLDGVKERYGGLSIDLTGDKARVLGHGEVWEGAWTASPSEGSATAIIVTWDGRPPLLGRRTTFVRENGRIAIMTEGPNLPLSH